LRAWDFAEFGAENMFPISVSHNRKLNPLYRWLTSLIPPSGSSDAEEDFDLSFEEFLERQEQRTNSRYRKKNSY